MEEKGSKSTVRETSFYSKDTARPESKITNEKEEEKKKKTLAVVTRENKEHWISVSLTL